MRATHFAAVSSDVDWPALMDIMETGETSIRSIICQKHLVNEENLEEFFFALAISLDRANRISYIKALVPNLTEILGIAHYGVVKEFFSGNLNTPVVGEQMQWIEEPHSRASLAPENRYAAKITTNLD